MSVRVKTLLVVLLTLGGLIGILYIISRLILLDSYTRLETAEVQRNLERALNALQDDINGLERTTFDYAAWDDSYTFIQNGNQDYIDSNFPDTTYLNNQLAAVVFVNLEGRVIFAQGFDVGDEVFADLPVRWQGEIFADHALLEHANVDSAISGIMMFPNGPMLVASRPILTSAYEGPIMGTLIMARALNADEIQRLADTVRLSLNFYELSDTAALPADVVNVRQPLLITSDQLLVHALSETDVAGYALQRDINGDPALILRVTLPRYIYQQGQASLSYLVLSLVLTGVVFGLVVVFLLELIVITRLSRLSTAMRRIGSTGNFAGRVEVEGNDEIAHLGHTLNHVLSDLAHVNELLGQEQAKAERLLLNVLPTSIADRLKRETATIADHYSEVTILFADIVDFTYMSSLTSPEEMVALLNRVFSEFDQLADKHQLEKIKTIGDAYMVVGGLPEPRADHAEAVAEMALDMQTVLKEINHNRTMPIDVRIGINTGPVVAGVIGTKKFLYDLWGDTVNTASRMESFGVPGRIQVTESTYKLLHNKYIFEGRGAIQVKGKGEMTTYFLSQRTVEPQ